MYGWMYIRIYDVSIYAYMMQVSGAWPNLCMCVYVFMYIYVCMYVCMYAIYMYMYIGCMHVCIYVCMYAIYIYMYIGRWEVGSIHPTCIHMYTNQTEPAHAPALREDLHRKGEGRLKRSPNSHVAPYQFLVPAGRVRGLNHLGALH